MTSKKGATRITALVVLALLLSYLTYQLLTPIDDPSLDGPRVTVVPVPNPNGFDAPHSVVAETPQVFWGDLHIHTSLSSDAFTMGVRAVPDDVYRFAKGETLTHGAGYPVTISRALDFAAVTDHAEYLGQAKLSDLDVPTTRQALSDILRRENRLTVTRSWWEIMSLIRDNGFKLTLEGVDADINRLAWEEIIAAAERHNAPGVFTTFAGWEWSADAGDVGTHLHRNIIYGGGGLPDIPFSAIDGPTPPELWAFLRAERALGRRVMAIPHNPNLSEGLAYRIADETGKRLESLSPVDRSELEPLSEILQIKGSSETHPLLSSLDEFADFEIAGTVPGRDMTLTSVKGAYARDALRSGISMSHSEGFNPLKFGVIGSSDSHNATSPSNEKGYTGKLPMMDGSAGLRTGAAGLGLNIMTPARKWGSGGLAGVWAAENTREALFDAMQRRETFATSGPRIVVSVFAGWSFPNQTATSPNFDAIARGKGVPMGSTLVASGENEAPEFVVVAERDPVGANLDRIQMIKGWVDAKGESQERIYDVAWSGDRVIDSVTKRLSPVGSTVDAAVATFDNSIGSPQLRAQWKDPDFDASQEAFYYARVLEIPTPRWSTYDAVQLGTKPMAPVSIQERAISSAIWYQP
ncbi:DUF3604 domain-containing protein [Candidatus Paraluminiphilus aquimaris]|uniref:DUF3604 domain-containing protein n=1 Tax=Candidatus Paraluminiphilus aquimaris TaxID=2518994 RepID=UPI00242D3D5E|nr:DUF3604 domain-containing protein [Candidatus Paraluminiphilus aquimaris]